MQIMGLDHIMVAATDLDRSDEFYRLIFGKAAQRTTSPARLWYDVGTHTRLGVEQVGPGERPSFHHLLCASPASIGVKLRSGSRRSAP